MKTKIIRDFRLVAFFLILIPAATLPAKSVILPVEAIEDSADLSAGDFESMYPGIDVSGYIPDEEGYYIRYSHENLTYFFGPIDEFGEAVLWKDKLEVIRTDVISVRLTLQKSEISIYHFNHEMLMAAKEEMDRRKQGAEGSQSGVAGGTEEASQSGQGEEGEYIIVSQDSGQQGQDSGLFGQTTEQLGEMGEQQGQQGQESQRGQQGQEIQFGQMGQDGSQQGQQGRQGAQQQNQQRGFQFPQIGQQSQQRQQGRQSQQSSRNSSSSSSSSSSQSSSSAGGGPPMPSSSQPTRSMNWWELIRSIFGGR